MASLTIRNIDDDMKERLRVRAAQHGHSMEEEARIILRRAVGGITGPALWDLSRKLFKGEKGVKLDLPARSGDRDAPRLDGTTPRR
ncbi:MAG: hypothetical protein EPO55_15065 [Reyranella sp.]|uniref:FitA-like ribbon-helix-helix domain-containing protein n=1 Tax=Reyranella sp. TaxID=1929291 RepID=UPI00121B4239|nr:hypothetical protein [Reyranella sp.]TAJ38677.1 MAG: hypothetical protein EPO55_15065 [Reyranella sp.]